MSHNVILCYIAYFILKSDKKKIVCSISTRR